MVTRSQIRIVQLENQVESMKQGMYFLEEHFEAQNAELDKHFKDKYHEFLEKLSSNNKKLQARIAELEKENEKLSRKYSDLWHYGCNDDLSDVNIVEMLLEKGEKERVMDVWSDVYEENRDHFEFNEDSEDENEDTEDNE